MCASSYCPCVCICSDYPESDVRKSAKVNAQMPKTGSAMPSLQKANGQLIKAKSVVGADADFETINTWELMKDLTEEEDFADEEFYKPTLTANRFGSTTTLLDKPSHDVVRSAAASLNGAFSELIPRSKSLTSFQDGEVCLAANKDVISTAAEASLLAGMQGVNTANSNEARDFSRLTFRKLFNKMYQGDLASRDDGVPSPSLDERAAPERLNTQRALSVKYILNGNTWENDRSGFSDVSTTMAFIDEMEEEGLATSSCEGECSSSSLSPQLSATASLKDWLPSESPSVTRTDSRESDSPFDAMEASLILLAQQTSAHLLPNTRRVVSKYVGGGELENVEVSG